VLPAYLVGLIIAGVFSHDKVLIYRMRTIAFALLTPFFFIKAGTLVSLPALLAGGLLIIVLLGVKMTTKFIGVWPLTRAFKMTVREGTYTTLLMSTDLTFGSVSALYGLTHGIISQAQYTILVSVVIGSAVVPTFIAQTWFLPKRAASTSTDAPAQESSDTLREVEEVSSPVVFSQSIFKVDDGVFVHPLLIEIYHLTGGERAALTCQYVLPILIQFAGCRVHTQENINTWLVACRLDGSNNKLERFTIGAEGWSKATLVTNIGVEFFGVEYLLQTLIDFRGHAQCLTKAFRTDR